MWPEPQIWGAVLDQSALDGRAIGLSPRTAPVRQQWLARMLILRPIPRLILGDSDQETLQPNPQVTDFGAWFSGLLAYAPAAYQRSTPI